MLYRFKPKLSKVGMWELLLGAGILLAVGLSIALLEPQRREVSDLSLRVSELQHKIDSLPVDSTSKATPNEQLTLKREQLALENDRITLEHAIATTFIQTIGGMFFLTTAYLSWRNIKVVEEQQITERFGKAVELLGDASKLEVQIGGIYALERIAKDSPKDHWTIMEILTSFVQAKAPLKPDEKLQSKDNQATVILKDRQQTKNEQLDSNYQERKAVTKDIQAALTVIGRRSRNQPERTLDLSKTCLREAYLVKARLSEVDLSAADLTRAKLNSADLCYAELPGTHLSGSDLRGANLEGANLKGSDLHGALLNGTHFEKADLCTANLKASHLKGANLSKAVLCNAQLRGAELGGSNLSQADLEAVDLSKASLWDNAFGSADFRGALGLTADQIRSARHWRVALYDEPMRKELGLLTKPELENWEDCKETSTPFSRLISAIKKLIVFQLSSLSKH